MQNTLTLFRSDDDDIDQNYNCGSQLGEYTAHTLFGGGDRGLQKGKLGGSGLCDFVLIFPFNSPGMAWVSKNQFKSTPVHSADQLRLINRTVDAPRLVLLES